MPAHKVIHSESLGGHDLVNHESGLALCSSKCIHFSYVSALVLAVTSSFQGSNPMATQRRVSVTEQMETVQQPKRGEERSRDTLGPSFACLGLGSLDLTVLLAKDSSCWEALNELKRMRKLSVPHLADSNFGDGSNFGRSHNWFVDISVQNDHSICSPSVPLNVDLHT